MSAADQLAIALASALATAEAIAAIPVAAETDDEAADLVRVNADLDAREGQIVIVLEAAADNAMPVDVLRTLIINVLGTQP